MRHRDTLILFIKQPRLGTVKTRLARDLGAVTARQVYARLLGSTLQRLARDRRWRTVLAVTPDGARWRDWRGLPRVEQGTGDLGARMTRALRRLARPRAVLVGSDVPGISAAAVARAFRTLGSTPFVFGPAPDGGYWLVGWRRGAWPRGALQGVRWSTAHALADSLRTLPGAIQVDALADIDDLADYNAWRQRASVNHLHLPLAQSTRRR